MTYSIPHLLTASALLAGLATVQADDIRFTWNGAGDGSSFADDNNWNFFNGPNGTVGPGDVVDNGAADTSNVIMQANGATTTVAAPFTAANPFDILIVRSGHTLEISANLTLTGVPLLVGQTAGGGTVNHAAGTYTLTGLTLGSGGVGQYNLSGTGSVSATSVNINNNSILSLSGAATTFSANSLMIDSGSSLNYAFGTSGINPIALAGAFDVTSGALLSVDGSAYTGGEGIFDLVTFGSNSGAFVNPGDISISGFDGFITSVNSDSDSLFLTVAVPEPSVAMLIVLGAGALVLRRRLR